MIPTAVIAIFCEDIREEKVGHTLIGLLPDNVNVSMAKPQSAGITQAATDTKYLSKLCIYIRIHFDPSEVLSEGAIRLVTPDGKSVDLGTIDRATVDHARVQAKEQGNPIAGLFTLIQLGGFALGTFGRINVEVSFGAKSYLAGSINFQPVKDTLSS